MTSSVRRPGEDSIISQNNCHSQTCVLQLEPPVLLLRRAVAPLPHDLLARTHPVSTTPGLLLVAEPRPQQVTAHVHSDQSGRDAILAGVDSLEHASLLDDATIALAHQRGVALSMDIYNGTYTDTIGRSQGYPEIFLQRNTQTTEAQRAVFKKAYAAGVTLLYGTDAAVLPHTMGGWQFATMIEHGMTPMEAIRSATSVAADHLRIDADVGAVIPGRQADIIAVKVDPLTDPLSLRDVDVVIQAGIVVKQPPL